MPKLILFFLLCPLILHANVITVNLSVDQTGVNECLTGVSSYEELKQIELYPNPVTDILSVKIYDTDIQGQVNTAIYNLLGEAVYVESISITGAALDLKIDLENQTPGIYFIQIQSAHKQYYSKIILN